MKNHLKRISSPRTWTINRKENVFIAKSQPGAHRLDSSLPLGVVIRDFLKFTATMREAKKLLNNKQVLIDGKRKKDAHLPVGLLDVLSFPEIKENFRILLDKKGRLCIKKIDPKESDLKPCKINGKKILPNKKIQLNLHDGRNLLVDEKFKGKIGDTVYLSLPDQKIKEVFELKKDAFVLLIRGKHSGAHGLLQEIKGNQAVYKKDEQNIETLKKYLFVLGDKKPLIDIEVENKI